MGSINLTARMCGGAKKVTKALSHRLSFRRFRRSLADFAESIKTSTISSERRPPWQIERRRFAYFTATVSQNTIPSPQPLFVIRVTTSIRGSEEVHSDSNVKSQPFIQIELEIEKPCRSRLHVTCAQPSLSAWVGGNSALFPITPLIPFPRDL